MIAFKNSFSSLLFVLIANEAQWKYNIFKFNLTSSRYKISFDVCFSSSQHDFYFPFDIIMGCGHRETRVIQGCKHRNDFDLQFIIFLMVRKQWKVMHSTMYCSLLHEVERSLPTIPLTSTYFHARFLIEGVSFSALPFKCYKRIEK